MCVRVLRNSGSGVDQDVRGRVRRVVRLDDRDLDALLGQRERTGEACNRSADDDYLSHRLFPPLELRAKLGQK